MTETDNTQQSAGTQAPAGSQTEQLRPCPKDCSKCGFHQHAFCAAKMSFDAFTVMSAMLQRLDMISQRIADLETRVTAIQSSEAELAAPAPIQRDLFQGTE